MDKLVKYRQYLIEVLTDKQWSYENGDDKLNANLVADTERDHFMIVVSGWKKKRYAHRVSIHLAIIGEKIWFMHNMTEHEIVDELMAKGVPAQDIVLGWISEEARIATGFATA